MDIATPPRWHAPLAVSALAAGCHVLCEKPLATSRGDRESLLRATREAGMTLFTVNNWKHSAQFAALSALLGEGAIGSLVHVRLETVRAGSAATVGASWRRDPDDRRRRDSPRSRLARLLSAGLARRPPALSGERAR